MKIIFKQNMQSFLSTLDLSDLQPVPLPQKTGDPFFIDYTDEYVKLFGYFLALLQKDEKSDRGLKIANFIIKNFPTHYTAWSYKFEILEQTPYDYDSEVKFIEEIILDNPKSYQAWHYRQWLVDRCEICPDEIAFLVRVFLIDAKNFHAWNFALWYGKRWDKDNDIFLLTTLQIRNDPRNNSAWNARRTIGDRMNVDLDKEFNDAEKTLMNITKNEAACNFVMSLADKNPSLKPKIYKLGNKMLEKNSNNPQAYRLLLYVANQDNNTEEIHRLCDELMKIDPIRVPYYTLLKQGKIKFQ